MEAADAGFSRTTAVIFDRDDVNRVDISKIEIYAIIRFENLIL